MCRDLPGDLAAVMLRAFLHSGTIGADACHGFYVGVVAGLAHFDQEQILAGLLVFAGVFGADRGHLFHRKPGSRFGVLHQILEVFVRPSLDFLLI